jgi:hypothetical protein
MERKVGHTIHDILETIERVQWKTRGRTFAEFENELGIALHRSARH